MTNFINFILKRIILPFFGGNIPIVLTKTFKDKASFTSDIKDSDTWLCVTDKFSYKKKKKENCYQSHKIYCTHVHYHIFYLLIFWEINKFILSNSSFSIQYLAKSTSLFLSHDFSIFP